jgi:hypothetical protein
MKVVAGTRNYRDRHSLVAAILLPLNKLKP